MTPGGEYLQLIDWRRRVAELYVDLRRRPPEAATLAWFREQKDALYRTHPQSPLPASERDAFEGLPYWPYDPSARVAAHLRFTRAEGLIPRATNPSEAALRLIGQLSFAYGGQDCTLDVFWVEAYGGGLFVPFRDATSGSETYGGGRYLLDTIKSADLGSDWATSSVLLDFNYAYHPSCAFDPRWVCPLAPPENTLPLRVEAGERSRPGLSETAPAPPAGTVPGA